MGDIIRLLPDSIANQIAAGEVIQRPASVVKELVENAVDAGSMSIKIVIKDAGKTLIQIIDNGCGMSETDARMAFERHATSKLREAKDLFAIRTMGFRGEAMASIAAIAHVEMRTRKQKDELGTRLVIEGSEVVRQEACQCVGGTNISVKNLFYNVPARRNFLKSNTVEMRHIIDEFQRIALAHPDIFFSLHHNGAEIFHLTVGNLRQRVVGLFGGGTNKKLVPVNEETDFLKITGFVGKPEFAKKTRGEQFFYVNNRYIKSGYLNHAVMGAYEEILPKNTYPFYTIFIDIDPAHIDVNVHPTKQEIKFDDERLVYNYLKVTIRHALGQYHITPTLDFEQETSFNFPSKSSPSSSPTVSSSGKGNTTSGFKSPNPREKANLENWKKLYEGLEQEEREMTGEEIVSPQPAMTIKSSFSGATELDDADKTFTKETREPYQVHQMYIISPIKSGFLVIDQQAAHERILYEKYLKSLKEQKAYIQKLLFPLTINLSTADSTVLKEILQEINHLGFDLQEFGKDTFVLHGMPAEMTEGNEQSIIEQLLEQYKSNVELQLSVKENLARSFARSTSIKKGKSMTGAEMESLIDQLFACEIPFKSPQGKNCFITFDLDDLAKKF